MAEINYFKWIIKDNVNLKEEEAQKEKAQWLHN